MSKKSSNVIKISLATNGFVIVFIFLLIILVIRPAMTEIFRLRKRYAEYNRVYTELSRKYDQLERYRGALLTNDELLHKLNFVFPYDYNYSYLARYLQYLVEDKLDSKIISIGYNKNVNTKLVQKFRKSGITRVEPVTFYITIEGDLTSMLDFVRLLEQSPFMPQVLMINYELNNKKIDNKETYTITFVVYKTKRVISYKDMYDIR